ADRDRISGADLSMSRGPADLWGGFEANRRFDASCRSACRVSRPCRIRILLRPQTLFAFFALSTKCVSEFFCNQRDAHSSRINRVYAVSFQFETRPSGRPRFLIRRSLRTGRGDFPLSLFHCRLSTASRRRVWWLGLIGLTTPS